MDTKQPDIHSRIKLPSRIWYSLVLIVLALLACNSSAEIESEAVVEAVASTLTAVAQSNEPANTTQPAEPTETSPPPAPTDTVAPGPTATNTPASSSGGPTEESSGVPGVISGSLSYPSEQIPRLAVVFFNLDDGSWWWVGTAVNQSSYRMTVPVGRYHVVAYAEGGIAGGYTAAVPCGLTVACTDHSLLTVQVGSNARVNGIDVTDWYAPAGTFPPKPAAIDYP